MEKQIPKYSDIREMGLAFGDSLINEGGFVSFQPTEKLP